MATHWGSPCPLCGRLVRGWEKQMTEACPWLKCVTAQDARGLVVGVEDVVRRVHRHARMGRARELAEPAAERRWVPVG